MPAVSAYLARRDQTPLQQVASIIRTNIGNAPLQVIAPGVEDGTITARLVQLLLDDKSSLPANLCLVDISLPLLSNALGSIAVLAQSSTVFQHSLVGVRPCDMLLLDTPWRKEDCDIQTSSMLLGLHCAWCQSKAVRSYARPGRTIRCRNIAAMNRLAERERY